MLSVFEPWERSQETRLRLVKETAIKRHGRRRKI